MPSLLSMLLLTASWMPAPQAAEDLPVLQVGESVEAVVQDGAPVVTTPALATFSAEPTVARRYRLQIPSAGEYHVDLVSDEFDTYLILRDEAGNLLTEDDDGAIPPNSRLTLDLDSPGTLLLDVAALHGQRGGYELSFQSGPAPPVTGQAIIEDLRRLAARGEAGDVDGAVLAQRLSGLAYLFYSQGRLDAAEAAGEPALALVQRLALPDDYNLLFVVASLDLVRARFASAQERFERLLEVHEAAAGPEAASTGQMAANLAVARQGLGEFDDARALYGRALTIYAKTLGENHPERAIVFSNRARLNELQYRYAEAAEDYASALAIQRSAPAVAPYNRAVTLNGLAFLRQGLGKYAEADGLYADALAEAGQASGPLVASLRATILANRGMLRFQQGDSRAARKLYEEARAIRRELAAASPEMADLLANFGSLAKIEGDNDEAVELYEEALALREALNGPDHHEVAKVLHQLAGLSAQLDDDERAWALNERALTIRERQLGPEHPAVASSLIIRAELLQKRGDVDEALAMVERGLAIRQAALPPEHPLVASALLNLGRVREARGELAEALAAHEQALALYIEVHGDVHPSVAKTRTEVARLLVDLGRSEEAWTRMLAAEASGEGHRRAMLAALTDTEMRRYLDRRRWQLETLLSIAGDQDPVRGYESLLLWKGRVLRTQAEDRRRWFDELDANGELAELQGINQELATLSWQGDADDPGVQAARLEDLLERKAQLEHEALEARTEAAASPIWTAVRAALPDGSALVDLFIHHPYVPARWAGDTLEAAGRWDEPHVGAWITRFDGNELVYEDLGEADELAEAIKGHLVDLGVKSDRGASPGARVSRSDQLRDLLWTPLAAHLDGIDLVFVSPDGELATLPFETIRLESDRYLIEECGFVYLTDASRLTEPAPPRPSSPSLLAAGGVDYSQADEPPSELPVLAVAMRGSRDDVWEALPQTGPEAARILERHATEFQGVERELVQGSAATEEQLKLLLPHYDVAHLATHAEYSGRGLPFERERDASYSALRQASARAADEHPGLLSSLVWAGANRPADGRDDGYLTALEVTGLDLSGVDLVVLSACETGLGKRTSGEGLIGLRRSFELAGASTVISSLWSVRDESTLDLMLAFYKNLWVKRLGKHAALREAQLDVLEGNRIEHGSALPLTWGAFVLDGDWR